MSERRKRLKQLLRYLLQLQRQAAGMVRADREVHQAMFFLVE